MSAESLGLRRAELPARTRAVLNRGNRRNPDVLLVESDAGPVVVKDFAPRGALVRRFLGPWIHRRELRAYRALEGHPAVPRLVGEIDRLAFAVEYRPGERMSRRLSETAPPDFADALERAIAQMHARGVAHLDLRHRSNVLLDAEGRPVLIDFGSAVCLPPGSWRARLLMPLLAWLDRRALAKWRRKLAQPPAGSGPAGAGVSGGASDGGRGASRPT